MVIGQEMDNDKVESALNECLLTDEEMKLGPKAWEAMEDPFKEQWDKMNAEADGGHDHEGHDHHPAPKHINPYLDDSLCAHGHAH